MMPIPNQQIQIQDPGLGLVEPIETIPLFVGYSSLGTANVLGSFNSVNDLVAQRGQGPSVEDAATTLANAGGPVLHMKLTCSVAGANSAVTELPGGGPLVTVTGTANDDYDAKVTIDLGGALGVGKFHYSLDGNQTPSETLTIPAGGSFAIANSGLTLTFASGTYVLGSVYSFTTTAPMFNSSDLSAGFAALAADLTKWSFIVASGRQATGSAAATLYAALESQLNTFQTQHRYVAGMIDGGDEAAATVAAAHAATTGKRVMRCYRDIGLLSSKPFPGWSSPVRRNVSGIAMRAAQSLISTDLGRFASGPIPGARSISHNEYVTETMDQQKFATMRTWPGYGSQIFITNGRLPAPAGSDFQYWQYRRVMDVACETVYEQQAFMANAGFRAKPDGTMADEDRIRWENRINNALRIRLTQPLNEEGTPGHVSDVKYKIDSTWVITNTNQIVSEVAVQPLGYGKFITTRIGFVAQILAA
jgi:hypothetical protein